MGSKLKAILWLLTLLTLVYVSQQYRVAQQARASAQTQHTTFSATPNPSFKVTQIGGQVMRINETTGETHYWSTDGGGWVKINETELATAASYDEIAKRKAILREWYRLFDKPSQEKLHSYEEFEAAGINTFSGTLEQDVKTWKITERESITQRWYQLMDEKYKKEIPYDKFKVSLSGYTLDQIRLGYENQKNQPATDSLQAPPTSARP